MKKLLLLVLLTSMFGTAHATRSRMNSLGQDPNQGSFYLMDNRNFFRNPANAAKMRNFMVAELGTDYAKVADKNVTGGGNVEGGYFGEFNSDMAYGVYLGKRNVAIDGAVSLYNVANAGTATLLDSGSANPLNLFLGGGSDMKWGLNLAYASTDKSLTGGDQQYDNLGLAVGIETSGGLQVYVSYQDATTEGAASSTGWINNTKIESAPMTIGLIYGMNAETTLFAQYNGGDIKTTVAGTETKNNSSGWVIGVGRIYELSPTARFNFDLSYNQGEVESGGGKSKVTTTRLPITVGLEADAAEWLILRASVAQNFILGDVKNTSSGAVVTKDNSALTGTRVALGGTLHFGKLKIDGNLGGVGGDSNTALFSATNFFVNAAATYMF